MSSPGLSKNGGENGVRGQGTSEADNRKVATPRAWWLAALAGATATLLQLVLFLPPLLDGKTPGIATYRVDSLSLLFGVAWSLTIALAALALGTEKPMWLSTERAACRLRVRLS